MVSPLRICGAARFFNPMTPPLQSLHLAARTGDIAVLWSFLQKPGVRVDAVDRDGLTALYRAAEFGHTEAVAHLLQAGALIDFLSTPTNYTPLQIAAINESTDALLLMLNPKWRWNGDRDHAINAAIVQALQRHKTEVAMLLIDSGVDVNRFVGKGPLHAAAEIERVDVVKHLLFKGALVNKTTVADKEFKKNNPVECGWTALHYAVFNTGLEVPQALIDAGADVNLRDAKDRTTLDNAVPEVIPLLIKAGIDMKRALKDEWTPLQRLHHAHGYNMNEALYNAVAALVAAGDHNWGYVPTPCPGLERALVSVWEKAPEELPQLFQRLTQEAQESVRNCLKVVHGKVAEEAVKMMIVGMMFEDKD